MPWVIVSLKHKQQDVDCEHYGWIFVFPWELIWWECSFGDPRFLRKKGHYFKNNCTYLVSLCFDQQVGDTIVDRWPQFECDSNVLPILFCHTATTVSTWQPVPEPINGVTGTWLSCFTKCDWLRAFVHLHYNVIITKSSTKTWWSCRSLGVDLPYLRTKIRHQNTMLMRSKVCKCKDEDL